MTQLNPNWMQNDTYSAKLDRQVIKAAFTEGVLSGLVVTQDTGANMLVRVAVGVACIYGDDQTDQGAYLCTTTASETVTVGAAPGSNSRIDLIYYRVNDPNAGGPAGNNSAFGIVAGTPAASPAVPALPTSAIPLATVLVASGTVAITNALVTDTRGKSYHVGTLPPGTIVAFAGVEANVPADWLLCAGQSVVKQTYFGLFNAIGATYGSTSTNFTVPDLRGRSIFGLDNMTGSDAGRLAAANTLGGTGGTETSTLTTTELPAHTHTTPSHVHSVNGHVHDMTHDHGNVVSDNPGNHAHWGGTYTYYLGLNPAAGISWTIGQVAHTPGTGNFVLFTQGNSDITWQNFVQSGGHVHNIDLPNFAQNTGSTAPTTANDGSGTSGSAGSGAAFSNMPPYMLMNWIIKT